jgi:hypothetical protein
MPIPGAPKLVHSYVLIDTPDGGTHAELRIARPRPKDRVAFDQISGPLSGMVQHSMDAILPLLAAEAARAGDDVEIPASRGGFATEPVGS